MRKRKYFALAVQHMQHRLAFFVLLCIGALSLLPAQAQSPTTPQEMPISISKPKPPGQTGLRRPVGDGNVWTFRVVPEENLVWVEGPNWSYPGKGEGTEPDWGQWGGGDDELWLSWVAPQKAGAFTIRMTGKVGKPGSGGGEPVDVEASWEGEVEPFRIEFEGLARACAGGVGADGVHDFGITAIAKDKEGSPLPGITLKFSFENNKGHDYGDGTPPKRAKYILGAGQTAVPESDGEAMVAITDTEGKVPVHVLSSDIVSNDIEIKVSWTSPTDEEKEVGGKACDFAASRSLRRFGLVHYPEEEDTGWIFNAAALGDPAYSKEYIAASGTTPAKVYLKFQVNSGIPRDTHYFNSDGTPRRPLNDDGNWRFVNGHRLRITIVEIVPHEGMQFSGAISDYATLLNRNGQPVEFVEMVTIADGAAQVQVKAEELIAEAKEVVLAYENQTEW